MKKLVMSYCQRYLVSVRDFRKVAEHKLNREIFVDSKEFKEAHRKSLTQSNGD